LPKSHLTAAAVVRFKPPRTGQVDHFDAGYPGLALRISYGGTRTWVWFYRQNGKLRRLTLGTLEKLSLAEAREAWRLAREQLNKGMEPDPIAPAPSADDAGSVRKVVEEWLRRDQKTNRKSGRPARAFAEVERIMNREVLPHWRNRHLVGITPQDVEDLIDAIVDRGAITMACRVHARLHRFFRWAAQPQRHLIDVSPMQDMPRPRAEIKRKRVLSDDELRAMWNAAGQIGWPMGSAIQLLVLTGARRDEIGALRWIEIDDKRNQIWLRGDLDRTKNDEDHIPLSAMARELIDGVPRLAGSPFVFSTTKTTPISGWSKVKVRIDALMEEELGRTFEPWRLHDLRRTAATGLERLGVPLQVTEALLGHTAGSKGGIAGVYQLHQYAEEKREAIEKWAQHVASLLSRER
jgi:integrase